MISPLKKTPIILLKHTHEGQKYTKLPILMPVFLPVRKAGPKDLTKPDVISLNSSQLEADITWNWPVSNTSALKMKSS